MEYKKNKNKLEELKLIQGEEIFLTHLKLDENAKNQVDHELEYFKHNVKNND